MTAQQFQNWMTEMGLKKVDVHEAFGLSRVTIDRYLREGTPKHIDYACAAYAKKLKPWGTDK